MKFNLNSYFAPPYNLVGGNEKNSATVVNVDSKIGFWATCFKLGGSISLEML
jgi:hypothetical protein